MYFPDRRESGIFTGVVATITHLVNRLQRWGRRDGLFFNHFISVFWCEAPSRWCVAPCHPLLVDRLRL